MEIPDEMIEDLLPAVQEQLSAPETAYVKGCLERLRERKSWRNRKRWN